MKAKIFEAHMKRSAVSESVIKKYCEDVLPMYEALWNTEPQSKKTISLDSNLDIKQIQSIFNNITGSGDYKQKIVNAIKKSLQSAVVQNGKETLETSYKKVIAFLKRCRGHANDKARQAIESMHNLALQSKEMMKYAVVTFNTVMAMDTMNSSEQALDILNVGLSLSRTQGKNSRIEPTMNSSNQDSEPLFPEPEEPKKDDEPLFPEPEEPAPKNSLLDDIFNSDDEESPDESEYSHRFNNQKPAKSKPKAKKLSTQADEYDSFNDDEDDEDEIDKEFPVKKSSNGLPMNDKSSEKDELDHPYFGF